MTLAGSDFLLSPGGSAACLMRMWDAVKRGDSLDLTSFGKEAEPLLNLDRAALDALVRLYSRFHSKSISTKMREAKKRGSRLGKPKIPLTDVLRKDIEGWKAGVISLEEAAKHSGISISSFWNVAKRVATVGAGEMGDTENASALSWPFTGLDVSRGESRCESDAKALGSVGSGDATSPLRLAKERHCKTRENGGSQFLRKNAFSSTCLYPEEICAAFYPLEGERYVPSDAQSFALCSLGILSPENAALLCGKEKEQFLAAMKKHGLHRKRQRAGSPYRILPLPGDNIRVLRRFAMGEMSLCEALEETRLKEKIFLACHMIIASFRSDDTRAAYCKTICRLWLQHTCSTKDAALLLAIPGHLLPTFCMRTELQEYGKESFEA